jgi:hypothetical protein
MMLLNAFSIIKYGAKIFLAVMGFISFEDINVKPLVNIDSDATSVQKINYVEKIDVDKGNISYANAFYFFSENNNSDKLFTFQNEYITASETVCSKAYPANNHKIFENIYLLGDEKKEDLEILLINDDDEFSFECVVKVIDDKAFTPEVVNSLKSIQMIEVRPTYEN